MEEEKLEKIGMTGLRLMVSVEAQGVAEALEEIREAANNAAAAIDRLNAALTKFAGRDIRLLSLTGSLD